MQSLFVALLPAVAGWALKATLLFVVAWGATALLRRQSASLRHLVWGMAACGALALPLLQAIAPRWAAPGLLDFAPAPPATIAEPELAPSMTHPPLEEPVPLTSVALPDTRAVVVDAAASVESPTAPVAWRAWLVPVWLAGGGLVLLSMLAGLVGTALLARRAEAASDTRLLAAWADARRLLGLRRQVQLLVSHDCGMPMTWGALRPVVLLPVSAAAWPPERARTVLLHELAHVRRHDFLTQLVARAACAVHWFNPLAWLAARRLREEREHACDDVVLASGARPSDYASHLLEIARTLRAGRLSAVTAVAMARPSQLGTRLLAVLDAQRVHTGVDARGLAGAVGVAGLLMLPLAGAAGPKDEAGELPKFLPTKAEGRAPSTEHLSRIGPTPASDQCDWTRSGSRHNSSSMNVDDDHAKISIVADDCMLDIEYRGELRFTNDDRDIAALSPGGYFIIEEREGRERRELEIRADGSGRLERKWFVNREAQPYGPEAEAWLARVLPAVFRRTGINAEARAGRILQERGPDGLLQEISLIPSDYVARKYYEILLTQPDLPTELVRRIVRDAGQRVDSDHELGRLLRTIAEKQTMDEAVRIAYVEAAAAIDSDYEHRRVLSAILGRETLSPELADAVLRSAKQVESDHELSRLLMEVVQTRALDEALTPAFFDAFENIESDYEQRRVLSTVFERGAPSRAILDRALAYAESIESSHERSRLLLEVAELYPADGALPASYLEAARGIGSDYELSRVLRTLVDRGRLNDAGVTALLEAATAIDSDHEMGRLLVLVIEKGLVNDATRPVLMRALDTVQSEHTRGQVLAKLYPRGRPA